MASEDAGARQTKILAVIQDETLSLINEEIIGRLERQSDSLDKIDTKAGLIVGYALAAASFLATRHSQPVLATLSFTAYGVATACAVGAQAVWNYQDTAPRELLRYTGKSQNVALAALAAAHVQIFEFNAKRQQAKARLWWSSVAALLLATGLMIAAILLQTYEHS